MTLFAGAKILLSVFILNACQSNFAKNEANNAVVGYDLNKRTSYELPKELDEISGHTFIIGNDNIVYCVQDELGELFAYNLQTKKVDFTIAFGPKGDYEGVTNDGNYFYVLKSNGDIYSFPISLKSATFEAKVFKNLLGKGEYESLAIDQANRKLVVFCKSCKADRKDKKSTGYLLNYSNDGNVSLDQSVSLDLTKVLALDAGFPKTFNPSAMTKKLSTNEWYFLSSIDKVILVTDAAFLPKEIIPFTRKSYEQPEGIAFDSNENLFISSEAGEEPSGMLYKITK